MRLVEKIFGSKTAGIFCFLFAITNRIIFTFLYSSIGKDTMVQLTYSENFMTGKGLGVTKYFINDPSHPVFDTHQLFPPAYSFSIIPFLKIFNNDEYKAVLAHDIISAILFILSVRFVGKKINLNATYLNTLTVIAGCSQYTFFSSGSATDAIGLSLLLFAAGMIIATAEKKQPLSFLYIVWLGLIFFLPAFYRFMYLPTSILLPVILFFIGLVSKNKLLKKTGLQVGIVVISLILLQLAISWYKSGNIAHVALAERGFFPKQIQRFYPFIVASFINLDFAAQQFGKIIHQDYQTMMLLFEFVNVILLCMLLYMLLIFISNQRKHIEVSSKDIFVFTGTAISCTILFALAYLTLTYKADVVDGHYTWTFLYDNRYFAFLYCFVQLLFFTLPDYSPDFFKNKIRKLIWIAFLLLLSFETLHGFYYNIKILINHHDVTVIKDRDKDYRSFYTIISAIRKRYPKKEIVVSSTDQFYLHKASLLGYKAFFDYTTLNEKNLIVADTTILLTPVYEVDYPFIREYIERENPDIFANINGTNFYFKELIPLKK